MTFPFESLSTTYREWGLVVGVLIGFGFGFVLERAGFGRATKLAAQFYGTEMLMLKVMFSAIVTAILGTVVLAGFGLLDLRALGDSAASGTFLWPMIVGGFFIGVGLIMSGYCPGTSQVAIASGKVDAIVAFLGVILGQLVYAQLEYRPFLSKFHNSGDLGHVYLYDLLKVPPAAIAVFVVAMAIGAFLFGEKVERLVNEQPAVPGPASRRMVFAGFAAFGIVAVATLALPIGTQAKAREPQVIGPLDLARRVIDEPWKVRVVDLRDLKACAAKRIPGSECVPSADLGKLGLAYANPARDLVLVAESGLAAASKEALAYGGRVLALEGGFKGWEAFALAPPAPPAPGASAADMELYRLRAGLQSALTGMKAAPPPPAPTAAPAGPPRKGGGGCGS